MIKNKLLLRNEFFDLAEEAADLLWELENDKILSSEQNYIIAKKFDHLFKSKIQSTKLRNDFIDDFDIKDISPSLNNNKDLESISKTVTKIQGLLLEEKEEILKALLDYSPIEIALKDENNNILRINNMAAKRRGGVVSDFEGKNVYDLFPYEVANKHHKQDLEIFNNAKEKSLVLEVPSLNTSNTTMMNVNKVPIEIRENKKIMLIFSTPEYRVMNYSASSNRLVH